MAKKQIATFLAPNKGLSIAGSHAYAFSGAVASPNSATPDSTLLEFTTGNQVIVCNIQFGNETTGNATPMLQFKMNNAVVMFNKYQIVGGYAGDISQTDYSIVLPPHTKFQLNFSINGTSDNGYATLTGTVYDA